MKTTNNKNQIKKVEAISFDESIMGLNSKLFNVKTPIDATMEFLREPVYGPIFSKDTNADVMLRDTTIRHSFVTMRNVLLEESKHILANYLCNVIMMFIDDVYRNSGISISEDMFVNVVDSAKSHYLYDIIFDLCTLSGRGNIISDNDKIIAEDDIITNGLIGVNNAVFTELSNVIRSTMYFKIKPEEDTMDQSKVAQCRDALYILSIQSLNKAIGLCTNVLYNQLSKLAHDFIIVSDNIVKMYENKPSQEELEKRFVEVNGEEWKDWNW